MEFANVEIKVPKDMVVFINSRNPGEEVRRNAMLLYPYIKDLTISHGRAAEIIGISRLDLISLYNEMGLAYLDMDISEVEEELETFRSLEEA